MLYLLFLVLTQTILVNSNFINIFNKTHFYEFVSNETSENNYFRPFSFQINGEGIIDF